MKVARLFSVLLALGVLSLIAESASAMQHPTLGRYLQRDPSGYVDGGSTYACYHSMRFGLDPTGLQVGAGVRGVREGLLEAKIGVPLDADDLAYFRGSGSDEGILAETMRPIPDLHGKSFRAESCNGQANCNIDFIFDHAFLGERPYHNRKVRGVYVKIRAHFDSAQCACNCDEVRFIQIVRRSHEPSSQMRRDRAGWGDPNASWAGWRVDQLVDAREAYYGANGFNRVFGNNNTDARLYDAPGSWLDARNVQKEFYSCIACLRAGQPAQIMGCVRWGYYIDRTGAVSASPAIPEPSCAYGHEDGSTHAYPEQLKAAVDRWNALPDHQNPNIDF